LQYGDITVESFTLLAKAISDPTRVRILKLLEAGELCVCEIMDVLGMGQSTVSKHLGILKSASLVECRKEGTWSYYRPSRAVSGNNRDFLRLVASSLEGDETVMNDKRLLKRKSKNECRVQGD
jgi:DNA-binding transcriptional ArsR family regulator